MKKLNLSGDVSILIKLFYNNSLNGMLDRPFFKKKLNRYFFAGLLFVLYFIYFYYNMTELALITPTQINSVLLESGQKITLFSYFDVTLCLGVFLYLLVNNTVALDKSSLFFAKSLPFKSNDVQISFSIFKFLIMAFLYELVMLIATPAIKLVAQSMLEFLTLFLTQQLFFILTFIVADTFYKAILKVINFKFRNYVKVLLDVTLLISALLYFFNYRYSVELRLSHLSLTSSQLIFSLFFLVFSVLLIALYFYLKYPLSESIVGKTQFIKLFSLFSNLFTMNCLAVFRNKNNWYTIIVSVVLTIILILQQGIKSIFIILTMLLPFSGLLFMGQADILKKIRKLFYFYRISLFYDYLCQLLLLVLFTLPLALVDIISGEALLPNLLLSFGIALGALILGYIFPKSESSINETTSMVLFLVLFALLELALRLSSLLEVIIVSLALLLYFLLKKEREINEKI